MSYVHTIDRTRIETSGDKRHATGDPTSSAPNSPDRKKARYGQYTTDISPSGLMLNLPESLTKRSSAFFKRFIVECKAVQLFCDENQGGSEDLCGIGPVATSRYGVKLFGWFFNQFLKVLDKKSEFHKSPKKHCLEALAFLIGDKWASDPLSIGNVEKFSSRAIEASRSSEDLMKLCVQGNYLDDMPFADTWLSKWKTFKQKTIKEESTIMLPKYTPPNKRSNPFFEADEEDNTDMTQIMEEGLETIKALITDIRTNVEGCKENEDSLPELIKTLLEVRKASRGILGGETHTTAQRTAFSDIVYLITRYFEKCYNIDELRDALKTPMVQQYLEYVMFAGDSEGSKGVTALASFSRLLDAYKDNKKTLETIATKLLELNVDDEDVWKRMTVFLLRQIHRLQTRESDDSLRETERTLITNYVHYTFVKIQADRKLIPGFLSRMDVDYPDSDATAVAEDDEHPADSLTRMDVDIEYLDSAATAVVEDIENSVNMAALNSTAVSEFHIDDDLGLRNTYIDAVIENAEETKFTEYDIQSKRLFKEQMDFFVDLIMRFPSDDEEDDVKDLIAFFTNTAVSCGDISVFQAAMDNLFPDNSDEPDRDSKRLKRFADSFVEKLSSGEEDNISYVAITLRKLSALGIESMKTTKDNLLKRGVSILVESEDGDKTRIAGDLLYILKQITRIPVEERMESILRELTEYWEWEQLKSFLMTNSPEIDQARAVLTDIGKELQTIPKLIEVDDDEEDGEEEDDLKMEEDDGEEDDKKDDDVKNPRTIDLLKQDVVMIDNSALASVSSESQDKADDYKDAISKLLSDLTEFFPVSSSDTLAEAMTTENLDDVYGKSDKTVPYDEQATRYVVMREKKDLLGDAFYGVSSLWGMEPAANKTSPSDILQHILNP